MLTRLGVNLLSAGFVAAGRGAVAAGLRTAPEGWRRTVGVVLRSEPTRFALSAFGLAPPPDPAAGLAEFLRGEPAAHYRLAVGRWLTAREPVPRVDVVGLSFGPDGDLRAVAPHLADGGPPPPDPDRRPVSHSAVVAAYNQTRFLPEAVRPAAILARVPAGDPYARRLLAACCVTVEPEDPAGRFRPPDFRASRTLGHGFLSVVVRAATGGTADVWVGVHHVGGDGAAMQELVSRLGRAWGPAAAVAFPEPSAEPVVPPRPCHLPGEREVYEALAFLDFGPLMRLRKRVNARLAADAGGEVTVGGLLAWRLAGDPAFEGRKIGTTVDVAASGGYDRDVDLVSLRPADYGPTGDDRALAAYAREFNRVLAAARGRASPVRRAAVTAGLLPAWLHRAALRANPADVDETFGTLGVTILRDAAVFVAPMADLGLGGGFLAVGGANLPTAAGRTVAAVSMKGDRDVIAGYPAAVARVLAGCAAAAAG